MMQMIQPQSKGGAASGLAMPEQLQPGDVYRLRRIDIGGYRHSVDYAAGLFIHVKIVSGPNENGTYECTTRGPDGKHLGPGGGWEEGHELRFRADQLEPLGGAR